MGHRYLEEFDNLGQVVQVGSKTTRPGKKTARDNSPHTVRQVEPIM